MKGLISMQGIVIAWTAFYLICQSVGRSDIPQKLLLEFHKKTMVHISEPWGCPSIFDSRACYRFKSRKDSHR